MKGVYGLDRWTRPPSTWRRRDFIAVKDYTFCRACGARLTLRYDRQGHLHVRCPRCGEVPIR
jgi:predicted RNA-binding Zn-ribbon protein involved in translation (DUF1610 family)